MRSGTDWVLAVVKSIALGLLATVDRVRRIKRLFPVFSMSAFIAVLLCFAFREHFGACAFVVSELPDFANAVLVIVAVGAFVPHLYENWSRPTKNRIAAVLIVIGIFGIAATRVRDADQTKLIDAEFTGGDTYCYFTADTSRDDRGTYPLTFWVRGKFPLQHAGIELQTNVEDKSRPHIARIPVPDVVIPGVYDKADIRIPLGRHIIIVDAANGHLTEVIELSRTGDGSISQKCDVFRNGKKLFSCA